MSTLICYTSGRQFTEILKTERVGTFSMDIATPATVLIEWGDGFLESMAGGTRTHDYTQAGVKPITIREGMKSITRLAAINQDVTGVTLRRLTGLSGNITFAQNSKLTRQELPETTNLFTHINFAQCDLFGIQDFTAIRNVQNFYVDRNPRLNSLILHPACIITNSFLAYQCAINEILPLGSVIRGADIRIHANGMNESVVNGNINQLYTNIGNMPTGAKQLFINSTGNAKPTGVALTQIADLRSLHNYTILHN